MEKLTDDERKLVDWIRQEGRDLKECFTRYSFQAMAVSAGALAVIARFQADHPSTALASVVVTILCLSVARLGTYKYQSANRIYGYELHLHRTLHLVPSQGWHGSMRDIGWEEAMRAWRVVQATTFRHLYVTRRLHRNTLRHRHESMKHKWFAIEKLINPKAEWHSGTYLDNMLNILYIVALGSTVPLVFMAVQLHLIRGLLDVPAILASLLTVVVIALTAVRIRQIDARRSIVEGGLLSIHSSAIMWQAVVAAHHRALARCRMDHQDHRDPDGRLVSFRNYTRHLSDLALELNSDIEHIYEWIARPDSLPAALPVEPFVVPHGTSQVYPTSSIEGGA